MENKKTKNHKENWIGNIIRGFLLFMPLLAIGVTCAYAIFNKNAYQSYGGEIAPKYQSNEVNSLDDLKVGNIYTFTFNQSDVPSGLTTYIKAKNVYNIPYNDGVITNVLSDSLNTHFYIRGNANGTLTITNQNYLGVTTVQTQNNNYPFVFQIEFMEILNNSIDYTHFSYTDFNIYENEYNSQYTIDSVFYYSIDKVQQSPLFNWAEDTGMYTVIHNACTTLGIQSTFMPFLLSYWLLTYLIYIIYDIALLIVNMAHNRIHDVESSI